MLICFNSWGSERVGIISFTAHGPQNMIHHWKHDWTAKAEEGEKVGWRDGLCEVAVSSLEPYTLHHHHVITNHQSKPSRFLNPEGNMLVPGTMFVPS